MNDDTYVAAGEDQVSCDLQGELAILSMRTGMYYGLSPVASRIWQWLERPIRVADLRERITSEFDVEPERAARDLAALLADLQRHELLTVSDDATRFDARGR